MFLHLIITACLLTSQKSGKSTVRKTKILKKVEIFAIQVMIDMLYAVSVSD
jgi:hypothetical protein